MRIPLFFALLTAVACATATVATPVAQTSTVADSAEALALFRENIDAIHKRDRPRYIATYLQSPRLARNGPDGLELGFENWPARTSTSWPDTLMARDLTVVPLAPGVVYGTYRYDVRYGDSVSTGVSERVFVKTPAGWRIAVTTAFGSPLVFSPRP
ncbi:MAG: nuclear transport factor 2 family protein [Gemmatimonadaceae bacterium]|nr:nuclear transport factor 2 family protein [Gemmatimonadaceae bacterium]